MLVFLLGVLDIVAAVSLFLIKFSIASNLAWFFVIYLAIKSLIFIRDFSSWIDLLVVGIFLLALVFHIYNIISYFAILWLLQKGVVSLLPLFSGNS